MFSVTAYLVVISLFYQAYSFTQLIQVFTFKNESDIPSARYKPGVDPWFCVTETKLYGGGSDGFSEKLILLKYKIKVVFYSQMGKDSNLVERQTLFLWILFIDTT